MPPRPKHTNHAQLKKQRIVALSTWLARSHHSGGGHFSYSHMFSSRLAVLVSRDPFARKGWVGGGCCSWFGGGVVVLQIEDLYGCGGLLFVGEQDGGWGGGQQQGGGLFLGTTGGCSCEQKIRNNNGGEQQPPQPSIEGVWVSLSVSDSKRTGGHSTPLLKTSLRGPTQKKQGGPTALASRTLLERLLGGMGA